MISSSTYQKREPATCPTLVSLLIASDLTDSMQLFKAEFWEPSLTLLCFLPSTFTWISNMNDNVYEMFSPSVLSSSFSDAEFFSSKLCCNHLQVVFAVFSLLFHPPNCSESCFNKAKIWSWHLLTPLLTFNQSSASRNFLQPYLDSSYFFYFENITFLQSFYLTRIYPS